MTLRGWRVLLVLAALAFVIWHRQRIYVRDPLASVTRDGVKQPGTQVLISYTGDVLLENYHPPMFVELIQHGSRVGTPAEMHCIAYVACLVDAHWPRLLAPDERALVTMDGRTVDYLSGNGHDTVVTLR